MVNKCIFGSVGVTNIIRWRNGSQANQIVMAILITYPVMSMGMIMGWISPALPQLKSDESPVHVPVTPNDERWMSSAIFVISTPLMVAGGWIANSIGRKLCILIASLSMAVCWLVTLIWLKTETIVIGRGISGIGNAMIFVVGPIYIKEISDDNIRGTLGSFLILAQNIGFIIAYVIGAFLPFISVLWISFLIPLVHCLVFLNAPESPSYLVMKGKIEEAAEVLAWLKSKDVHDIHVKEAIELLKKDPTIVHGAGDKSPLKLLWHDHTAWKAFLLCTLILFAQEMSGYLILLTYASEYFQLAGVQLVTPDKQAIVMSVIQLLGSILACFLVDRIGRRLLILSTSFASGIGMMVLGACFYLTLTGSSSPGWLSVSAIFLNIFAVAAGFQPISYVLVSEMFNVRIRGIVSSIAISLTSVADFMQTNSYPALDDAIGLYSIFWIFGIICFIATVVTFFFLPETKGHSVEEIYRHLRKKNKDVEMAIKVMPVTAASLNVL